jgi:hypothetical protein
MKIILIPLIMLVIAVSCSHEAQKKNESGTKIEDCCDTPTDRALVLKPYLEAVSDSSVTFVIEATRQAKIEGEYLPNSEDIRIQLESEKGKVVWISDYGKNFMQVISDVLPAEPGKVHKYKVFWNGQRNGGGFLEPGLYTVRAVIPAKPLPYFVTFKFEWKAGQY